MIEIERETELLQLLGDLVGIDSINPSYGGGGEAALFGFLESWLKARRISYEVQAIEYGRKNLVCRIGPSDCPAVLLDAHMDTVGVEGWLSGSPFVLRREGERYYGRGSCDTKASLAVFLSLLASFASDSSQMRRALVFAATVDEESEQLGAFRLAESLDDLGVVWAISGEPTRSNVVSRHKGLARYALHARGTASHASSPDLGVNAISKAARVCLELDDLAGDLHSAGASSALERGSLNIGLVSGGSGVNVVPDYCRIDIDRRFGLAETPEIARQQLSRICDGFEGVSLEVCLERPPLRGEGSAQCVSALQAAGEGVEELAVPFLTNAIAYEAVGVPSVVFGPGDIAQAHKVDEYIESGEMLRSREILRRIFI